MSRFGNVFLAKYGSRWPAYAYIHAHTCATQHVYKYIFSHHSQRRICSGNIFANVAPLLGLDAPQTVQEGTESNGYRGTGPGERAGSVNERASHHRVVSGQLQNAQTPANRQVNTRMGGMDSECHAIFSRGTDLSIDVPPTGNQGVPGASEE